MPRLSLLSPARALAQDYTPDGWLGMLLGSQLWYNFFDESKFEQQMEALCIKNLTDIKKKETKAKKVSRQASADLLSDMASAGATINRQMRGTPRP